jgi:hypothetical protein
VKAVVIGFEQRGMMEILGGGLEWRSNGEGKGDQVTHTALGFIHADVLSKEGRDAGVKPMMEGKGERAEEEGFSFHTGFFSGGKENGLPRLSLGVPR